MGGVFISYRRSETSSEAISLYRQLAQSFGTDRVFMDTRVIQPGNLLPETIREHLNSCDALIALIGKEWVSSVDRRGGRRLDNPNDYVRVEIATALERRILVIPVLVQDAEIPLTEELPQELAALVERLALQVSAISDRHWDYDVERLIEALRPALSVASSEVRKGPVADIETASFRGSRRKKEATEPPGPAEERPKGRRRRVQRGVVEGPGGSRGTDGRQRSGLFRVLRGRTATPLDGKEPTDGDARHPRGSQPSVGAWVPDTPAGLTGPSAAIRRGIVRLGKARLVDWTWTRRSRPFRLSFLGVLLALLVTAVAVPTTRWKPRDTSQPGRKEPRAADTSRPADQGSPPAGEGIAPPTQSSPPPGQKGPRALNSTGLPGGQPGPRATQSSPPTTSGSPRPPQGSPPTTQGILPAAPSSPQRNLTITGHTDDVNSVAFSPDGTKIVTGSNDGTVRRWETSTGSHIGPPMTGHVGWVNSVAFSPDGTKIASAGNDGTVRRWDALTGNPLGSPLGGPGPGVNGVAFSPDSKTIASGGEDGTVRLWDALTGKPVGSALDGHTAPVRSVAFSPDGTKIASGSVDQTVRLWRTSTGAAIGQPLTGHTDLVAAVAFSPDGTKIASASHDHTVRRWETSTGNPIGPPMTGHSEQVNGVAFSPDGTMIASAGNDNARLWQASTGEPVGPLPDDHRGWVWSVAFRPYGKVLATASTDDTVRLWNLDPP